MLSNGYRRVSLGDSQVDEEKEILHDHTRSDARSIWKSICLLTSVLLAISFVANISFLYHFYVQPQALSNSTPSQFANLRRDTLKRINPPHKFSSLNRTIQDAAWSDPRLNTWSLFVALEEGYAISHELPHSMRWPWDLNKGVYIPTAAHELHCVQVLRSFINDKQDSIPEADMDWNYDHSLHCLNILRESIMCNADDLPLYTGHVNENVQFKTDLAGRGQTRMCRNFDQLVNWAYERSACYLSTRRKDKEFKEIDRYKFCPSGEKPWEDV